MTAYDYLESAGEEPKEDDIALMANATTMLSALGRLRSMVHGGELPSEAEFLAAVDAEYDKLAASSAGDVLTRDAFHEVCSDIWSDAR